MCQFPAIHTYGTLTLDRDGEPPITFPGLTAGMPDARTDRGPSCGSHPVPGIQLAMSIFRIRSLAEGAGNLWQGVALAKTILLLGLRGADTPASVA